MHPIRLATIAATALILVAAIGRGDDRVSTEARTISVSGQGKVSASPDVADIQVGVVSSGKTAREAMSANNEAMDALLKKVKELGVAAKDVQTTTLNVSPRYNQPPPHNPNQPQTEFVPRIVGYEVNNTVSITARDLNKLGELLDALVTAGANQMHGISFRIDNSEKLLETARKQAVAEAKTRAELLAGEAGVVVGPPIHIRDEVAGPPPPRPMFAMARNMTAAPAVPIAGGEVDLTVTVSIVYELKLPK
jgi:uncharacterized protein YggE